MFPVIIFALFVSSGWSESDRLRLKVLKHQPCTSKPGAYERIRFGDFDHAKVVDDPIRGDGCYSIIGPVNVRQAVSGTVQIVSEVRFGASTTAPLEPCINADANGCGGCGSCVYCDACADAKKALHSSSGLVQFDSSDGRSFDCAKGIAPGNYTTIRINWCLPTKTEILKYSSIDDSFWEEYASKGKLFFLTIRALNVKVNHLPASQLQKVATSYSDHVIACHKIIGSVYEA